VRGDSAEISLIAPGVNSSVGVQCFFPETGFRQADAIVRSKNRSEIHDDGNLARAIGVLSNERKNAVVGIAAIDPIKAGQIVIAVPERGFVAIKIIEILDE